MQSITKSHLLLVGKQYGTTALDRSFAVSYKAQHRLTVMTHNRTPRYLTKRNENLRTVMD